MTKLVLFQNNLQSSPKKSSIYTELIKLQICFYTRAQFKYSQIKLETFIKE